MPDPPTALPAAHVQTRVRNPLRFADGWTATATVMTFSGLVDGGQHLALGLGAWEQALDTGRALARPTSECLTGDARGLMAPITLGT